MYLRSNIHSQPVASERVKAPTGEADRQRALALATTLNVPYEHVAHLSPAEVSARMVAIQQLKVPPNERGTYDYNKAPKRKATTKPKRRKR